MKISDEAERACLARFLDIDALCAIDWTTLSFPGMLDGDELSSASFPYHICNLTSSDPALRSEAAWSLHALQDDLIISDLTAKAVPFLLQLVSHPELPTRNDILEAFWSITNATRYQIASKPHLSSYACIDPPESDELILLQEVHQMFAEALPMLIACLTDERTDLLASHILSHFPEHVAEIWPTLVQTFLRVDNEGLKASVLESLAALAVGDPESCVPWLENIRLTHPSELVRFVATTRFPHVTRQNTSPAVVVSLVELLETQPEPLRRSYATLNAENPDCFFSDIISALRVCEPTERKMALPALQRLFAEHVALPHHTSLVKTIARALIEFAFPQANPGGSMPAVDHEQQQILLALCAYDPIWKAWRWDTHLKNHGLPGNRKDVLALCQQG